MRHAKHVPHAPTAKTRVKPRPSSSSRKRPPEESMAQLLDDELAIESKRAKIAQGKTFGGLTGARSAIPASMLPASLRLKFPAAVAPNS